VKPGRVATPLGQLVREAYRVFSQPDFGPPIVEPVAAPSPPVGKEEQAAPAPISPAPEV
jgi:hypothetical protein